MAEFAASVEVQCSEEIGFYAQTVCVVVVVVISFHFCSYPSYRACSPGRTWPSSSSCAPSLPLALAYAAEPLSLLSYSLAQLYHVAINLDVNEGSRSGSFRNLALPSLFGCMRRDKRIE